MSVKKWFDETFGPPAEALKAVRSISEAIAGLDREKLKLLKSIIDSAKEMRRGVDELERLSEVIRLVSGISPDHLERIEGIISRLSKLKAGPSEFENLSKILELILKAPKEHLDAVKEITFNISRIISYLPKEEIKKLKISEIIEELKK